MPALGVVVVEDESSLRELISLTLQRAGDFSVDTPDVRDWAEVVASAQPQVLLLDLLLEGRDALEDLPRVLLDSPRTMVAVLTGLSAEEAEPGALAAGAFVFYEKSMIAELPAMIAQDHELFQRALDGEDVVAPSALVRRPPPSAHGQTFATR